MATLLQRALFRLRANRYLSWLETVNLPEVNSGITWEPGELELPSDEAVVASADHTQRGWLKTFCASCLLLFGSMSILYYIWSLLASLVNTLLHKGA